MFAAGEIALSAHDRVAILIALNRHRPPPPPAPRCVEDFDDLIKRLSEAPPAPPEPPLRGLPAPPLAVLQGLILGTGTTLITQAALMRLITELEEELASFVRNH
jgi:hypothetical protein